MNKDDAELIIEKEKNRKENIQKRMHEYRTNQQFRKKNAIYMKEYRIKQKKILEDAKKLINNEKETTVHTSEYSDIKKKTKSEKTIKNYISIINKNHKIFNKTCNLDNKLLYKLFTDKLDDSDECALQNELNYLKDITKFIETMKTKYTNFLTLRGNINPYLIIIQSIPLFKINYNKLKKFYFELKKKK